jgi:hypothetical protein
MPAQEQSLPASLTTAFEHWSQLWQQASAFGPGALWAAALFRESRQLRKRWFAELTQITDRYLRSPA